MAPFDKRFASRHTIIPVCYRDEFSTNCNLAIWCKYKVFAAATSHLLKTRAASLLMATPVCAEGSSSKKAVAVQVGIFRSKCEGQKSAGIPATTCTSVLCC